MALLPLWNSQTRIRFTADGRSFQIDIASFDAFGTLPGATRQEGHAEVEATAILVDRTGGGQGGVVAEGLRLQLRITDFRNTADVAFALWDDSVPIGEGGRLLAASDWLDDHVPLQRLVRGNIQVQVR